MASKGVVRFEFILFVATIFLFSCATVIAFSKPALALPYDPHWENDTSGNSGALSPGNRRGKNPIHTMAAINPDRGFANRSSTGNHSLQIPIIQLPGRGIPLAITARYNSQVWSKISPADVAEPAYQVDLDGDWPAPGWDLGFGKLVFPNKPLFIAPGGTRRPVSPPAYESSGRVWASFADGGGGSIECPAGSNGCRRPGHVVVATLKDGNTVEFMTAEIKPNNRSNVYYPQKITDANGNYIRIDYRTDAAGNPTPPLIDRITDTVGRVARFHYDSHGLPIAVTGPNQGGGERVYARFYYHRFDATVKVPDGISNPFYLSISTNVLDAIYFPGNRTGYVFEAFTPYGIPKTVNQKRGLTASTDSLTEQGTLTGGLSTYRFTYNYPDDSDYIWNEKRTPTFSTRVDTWADGVSGTEQSATTTYSGGGGVDTIVYPDGSSIQQTTKTDRTKFDYGLAYLSRQFKSDGSWLSTTQYVWEKGANDVPRQKQVLVHNHEIDAVKKTEFRYGANNQQIEEVIEYEYAKPDRVDLAPVVRRQITKYLNDTRYLSRNFNLSREVSVTGSDASVVLQRTTFEYDNTRLQDVNPLPVGFLPPSDPSTPRGNLSKVTQWLAPESEPIRPNTPGLQEISTVYVNDVTGNVVSVAHPGAFTSTDIKYEDITQYSLPTETSEGGAFPLRVKTKTVYDINVGLPTEVTDKNGAITKYSYIPGATDWRIKKVADPFGVIDYRYKDDDLSLTVVDHAAGDRVQTTRYDGRGLARDMRQRKAGGDTIVEFEYDNMSRPSRQSLPRRDGGPSNAVRWIRLGYDTAGRLKSRAHPNKGETAFYYYNEPNRPPGVSSDLLGQTARQVDPWQREAWSLTDSLGRRKVAVSPNPSTGKVSDNGSFLTQYSYDELGHLTLIQQGLQSRRYKYDTLGRLRGVRVPERDAPLDINGRPGGGEFSDVYEYDNRSNLISHINPRGVKAIYRYGEDPLNRLQSVSYDLSGVWDRAIPIEPAATTTYTYETTGDLRRVHNATTEGVIQKTYTYHGPGYGWLSGISTNLLRAGGASTPLELNFGLISREGALNYIGYPAQYSEGHSPRRKYLKYYYSQDADLERFLLTDAPFEGNIQYGEFGVTQIDLRVDGQQLRETYEYDPVQAGRLTKQSVTNVQTNEKLLDMEYGYNAYNSTTTNGQLTRETDLRGDQSVARHFVYDGLSRLSTVQTLRGPIASPTEAITQTYGYDYSNNRPNVDALRWNGTSWVPHSQAKDGISYSVNALTNRIELGNGQTFYYDQAGNARNGPGPSGAMLHYVYDAAERLVRVEDQSGNLVEAYQYDDSRQRIGVSQEPGKWLYSMWFGGHEIARYDYDERTGSLNWRDMSIYLGSRLLAELRPAQGGQTIKMFHPSRRDTVLTAEAVGGVLRTTRQSVNAYGTDSTPGQEADSDRRFTSYRRSARTGLDYAINRYYDPKLGRFTQADPLGIAGDVSMGSSSLNLYAYVRNDPVNRRDPRGLKDEAWPRCEDVDWKKECKLSDGNIYDPNAQLQSEVIEIVLPPPDSPPFFQASDWLPSQRWLDYSPLLPSAGDGGRGGGDSGHASGGTRSGGAREDAPTKGCSDQQNTAKWTGVDDSKVERIVIDALLSSGGDVFKANQSIIAARWERSNWYDENLAAADDFLFAFGQTHCPGCDGVRQRFATRIIALGYEVKKVFGSVAGSYGPPSPASWAQLRWMWMGTNSDQLHGLCK